MRTTQPPTHDLVLVGGGHSHVQVLRRFAMRPVPGVRLTVVLDIPIAVYSGMVPGFVAGEYHAHEVEIDVVPLARRAGATVVLAAAKAIDPRERRVHLAGRPPLRYDVASLDVGSSVRGLDVPGVREHALATRPIGRFVALLDEHVASARARARVSSADRPLACVVVGAGAAGVELAFCLQARLAREHAPGVHVTLVDGAAAPLPGAPRAMVRLLERTAAARGIALRLGDRVLSVEPDHVRLASGASLPADLTVWAGGAAAHPWLAASDLPVDDDGYVRVGPTLQVFGHDDLFATGDCASLLDHPWVPKAGVYAVRAGPPLAHNLRALLTGHRLRRYRPQRDFLRLLNLGTGEAIGGKWGLAFSGPWVWRWKDRIDRRFMDRFQMLGPDGAARAEHPPMTGADGGTGAGTSADADAMPCGGCAAKVGQDPLARALARLPAGPSDPDVVLGLDAADDAAALRLPNSDGVQLLTIDAFRSFTDDAWLAGRVAAVNAVSDVIAKGAVARYALALVTIPETRGERAEEALFQVMAGARAALDPLGVVLLGGHTTTGQELACGFAITGHAAAERDLLPLAGLSIGERLVLTKPLGTGVLLRADMFGLARGPWVEALHAHLITDNAAAATIARAHGARAATDVTGFGLAGHLASMLRASGLAADLDLDALPALPGALTLLGRGLRSTAHAENVRVASTIDASPGALAHPAWPLLFDPQTAGGLLVGLPSDALSAALAALRQAGLAAAAIATVTSPLPDARIIRAAGHAARGVSA